MGSVGVEDVNPQQELQRLGERAESVIEFAELKPIYYRLNEIVRAFPGDFEVQFAASDIKQRIMARGALLKQRETAPSPAPAPPEPPPPALPLPPPPFVLAATPEPVPQAAARPPAPPPARPARHWNRAWVMAAFTVLLLALALAFLVDGTLKRNAYNAAHKTVPVDIATVPSGATVRVTAEHSAAGGADKAACISICKLALPPGVYRISASLDGFEPAAGAVVVIARQPAAVKLTLQPQAQAVRLLTDLDQGKVVLDDGPPVDLQEGQLALDRVAPGAHTVKVTGRNAAASFSFEVANARLPAVAGPVNARNMIAVLVASLGKRARVVTNAGPWKLSLNGQPQDDVGPAGTDLAGFQPGVNEIAIGEGRDLRNMSESFPAAPMLTAFLKTDVNAGTLIVSTGQDDVRVFLNGKEHRQRTQRGQLRIQILGKATVRVAKSGFQDAAPQTVEVKKGAEVRVQFDLKPQPQFGSLEIHGAMAGVEVLVDRESIGAVRPDGSFTLGAIQPGDHTVELRREGYLPKRLQRSFRAGQAVALAGADVALAAANGVIRIVRNPASAVVAYRRGDESEWREASGNQIELPVGSYELSAKAPGFVGSTIRVQLASGDAREVDFTLARERVAAPPVAPKAPGGMAEFENAGSWKQEGDTWVHKGGGFVAYKLPPKGVFTFTVQLLKGGGVFRAGQIRWCMQYLDSKNYLLYEMDRKTFWAGVVAKGQRLERVKAPHNLGNRKAFTIQIEVTPDRLVQKVRVGDEWKVLDTFAEPARDFTQGKFGFLIQGSDEIAISDFQFQPR